MRGVLIEGLVLIWGYSVFVGVSLGLAYVIPDAAVFYILVAIGNAVLGMYFLKLATDPQ